MIPLMVDLETEWRGGQSQMLLLLRGLYERGHAAELIAVKGSPLAHRARKENIYVHQVPRNLTRLRAVAKIRSVMGDGRIDLVHVNEGHALTAAWLAGAQNRVPLLSSRRIGFPLNDNWISKRRYDALAKFVANSKAVAQSLVDSGFPSERIDIVNEGVEIPEPVQARERQLARKKWGVAEDEYLIGCASAFVPEKGQRHLVEALPSVKEKFPKVRLLLVGEGPTRADIQAYTQHLNLGSSISLPGFTTHMREFYAALDAFAFPSEFEGLGTSLQSAMAHAIPVISTTRGALGEVVDADRTALVAEPDPRSFAAAMIQLLGNPALQKKLGAAGRDEIIGRFSVDRMVENTLDVYQRLA
ncbi:MAG: glycosyltransferase family 4 protein [Candidatus Acidiferrum sp.]